jgi:hypothetical protein
MAAAESGQNYQNHARLYPLFHYFVSPVLLLNVLWSFWGIFNAPSVATAWAAVVAVALLCLALTARVMPLAVQDRVIRLEMRLRLKELLPPELQLRIGDLSRRQLVALRFASDAELPALVHQVLAGTLNTPKDIKSAIKSWKGDYLRA